MTTLLYHTIRSIPLYEFTPESELVVAISLGLRECNVVIFLSTSTYYHLSSVRITYSLPPRPSFDLTNMHRFVSNSSTGRPSSYDSPEDRKKALQIQQQVRQRRRRDRKRAERLFQLRSSLCNNPSDDQSEISVVSDVDDEPERAVVLFADSASDSDTVSNTPNSSRASSQNSPTAAELSAIYYVRQTPSPIRLQIRLPIRKSIIPSYSC